MVVNLHFRGGIEPEGLEVLKGYDVGRAIFHWYSGTLELMDEINDAGFYYSVGQMHLPRRPQEEREKIAAMVRKIPEDRLLLEIDVLPRDAEALPSKVFRGILGDIADIKNMSPDDVEALNQRNVRELIGTSPRVGEISDLLTLS
jgi:TatD DNase family protein